MISESMPGRRFAIAGVLILVLVPSMMTAHGQPSDAEQVMAAEHALFDALRNQDSATLDKLLAQDFQFRNAGDELVSRKDFLKAATSGAGEILSVTSDNMRVQVHGEIAVLSGTQIAIVKLKDGSRVRGTSIFTDIFARRHGKWLLVFAHSIDLPDEKL